MIATNTTINKDQFPDLTKKTIIAFFADKLKAENISEIYPSPDEVRFKNEKFRLSFAGGKNKFGGFDSGCINVAETETEFKLGFVSSSKKTYALISKISFAFLILAFLISGFNLDSFKIGAVAFLAFSIEYTVHTFLNIYFYFNSFSQA